MKMGPEMLMAVMVVCFTIIVVVALLTDAKP